MVYYQGIGERGGQPRCYDRYGVSLQLKLLGRLQELELMLPEFTYSTDVGFCSNSSTVCVTMI